MSCTSRPPTAFTALNISACSGERHVPRRLPAHGGIHGKDETAAAGGRARAQLLHAPHEIGDVRVGGRAGRRVAPGLRRHDAWRRLVRRLGLGLASADLGLVPVGHGEARTRFPESPMFQIRWRFPRRATMPGTEDDKRRKACANGTGLQRLHAPPAKWFMNLLLLALVPACFALNPIIGRAMAEAFGPASLSVIRWAFSAIIVALLALSRGEGERWRAPAGHLLRVGALGALGMGFCAYAAFEGARTSPATNIALIYGCTSAFVAAWEIAAGRQKLNGRSRLRYCGVPRRRRADRHARPPRGSAEPEFHAGGSVGDGRHVSYL